jgi:Flp pilus assembly protein TadG
MAMLMTLVMATLLGAVALGTDVAVLYFNWMQLQKAADAAALAGAGELTALADPSGTVAMNATDVAMNATDMAKGYACLNGINDPRNTNAAVCSNPVNNPDYVDQVNFITVDPNDTQVSVRLTRQVPYYFAKVLGLQTGRVAAGATAQVLMPAGTIDGGLFPAGVQCDGPCSSFSSLEPGQSVTLGQKFAGVMAKGNWDWLDLGQGNGAKQLGDAVANGSTGTFTVGDPISSSPGNKGKSNPVRSGFQARMDRHNSEFPGVDPNSICTNSGGNPSSIPPGDPLLVAVPAVDFSGCKGKCSMNIEAFAMVYLTDISGGSISGCFVQAIAARSVGSSGAPKLGALSPPILIR